MLRNDYLLLEVPMRIGIHINVTFQFTFINNKLYTKNAE